MATFNVYFNPKKKNKNSTFPVYVLIKHQYQTKFVPTNIHLVSSQLNVKQDKIIDKQILIHLDKLLLKIRTNYAKIEDAELFSIEEIADIVKNIDKPDKKVSLDFVKFSQEQIVQMKQRGQERTAEVYQTTINALKNYLGKEVVDVSEITNNFITNWLQSMSGGKSIVGRGVQIKLQNIRTLHNKMREIYNDEDNGIINIPVTLKIKIPKSKQPQRRVLTMEQVQNIINFPTHQRRRVNFAKEVFLLSFGLCGLNSIDLYNLDKRKDDILEYRRQKTSTTKQDNSTMKIRIEPVIMPIVEKYFAEKSTKVFNFDAMYNNPHNFMANVNKGLKVIGKSVGVAKLTMYYARHSWATIAYNNAGIDKYTIHEALNHSDREMKITDIYIQKEYTKILDANKKVLTLFDWKLL